MQKHLVTGGTGFIGSALVHRLVRDGYHVRVIDNNSRGDLGRLQDIAGQIDFIQGDIREPAAVKDAVKGMDVVWHLAFVNGTEFFYSKPELVLDVGVKGMVNVLDACIAHKIPELLVASSSEVYQTPPIVPTPETVPLVVPDPMNPRYSYGTGKILSEVMTLNYGRKNFKRAIIFRPHNVFGPDMGWEHVIPQMAVRMKGLLSNLENPLPFHIQGDGSETRAFIYIDDFVDGLLVAFKSGGHLETYHIGTMEEKSIAEVARGVGSILGREIKIVPGQLTAGGTPRRCPDIAKLKALGFDPKITLTEGLKRTVPWYAENAHRAPVKK